MTSQLLKFFAVSSLFLAASCAQEITRPTTDRYQLVIKDNVKERRFDVTLNSSDSRTLCIAAESWPNSSGQFMVQRDDVSLQTGPNLLPAKSKLLSAYCPGGCGEHRVQPHASLAGFVSYEVFGDPEKLAAETEKELKFSVFPYYCR